MLGSIAQLVQSVCLTSRGSGVRLPLLPRKERPELSGRSFRYDEGRNPRPSAWRHQCTAFVSVQSQRRHRRRNKRPPAAKDQALRGARLKALLALDFCQRILWSFVQFIQAGQHHLEPLWAVCPVWMRSFPRRGHRAIHDSGLYNR